VIVGSAPSFPQGMIDPIEELSRLVTRVNRERGGEERGRTIGLHVDCCLGGFLLPFVQGVAAFDFRLAGVTSISADTHKFGFAPKGTSVVMFRTKELRRFMYFVAPTWPGGIYASPSMPGSRPGGLVAAAWAAMMAMGVDGYVNCANEIMASANAIKKGLADIEGLQLLGRPEMSVVSFKSVDPQVNIYNVCEAMKHRHWELNALQNPSALHICCTYVHRDRAVQFLQDLRACVIDVRSNPGKYKSDHATIYGVADALGTGAEAANSIITDMAFGFIDTLYKTRRSP